MAKDLRRVGEQIRAFRKRHAFTQGHLCGLLMSTKFAPKNKKLTKVDISRIESGRPIPTEWLRAWRQVTQQPAWRLRPDLAEIFK